MNILAIDVSVSGCSVAVVNHPQKISTSRFVDTDRGQAEMLIPMIEDVVNQSGLKRISDIDYIVVTRGPGSFTGVRIGLATARSLGLALDIPVIGVSTLDVIARAHEDKSALFLIDTKRGDYYGQVGEGGEARIWSEAEIVSFKGGIVKDVMPDILGVADMGAEIYQGQTGYDIAAAPTPIYLRGAEVSQSKKPSLYQIDCS